MSIKITKKTFYKGLFFQVLIAIVAGIIVGSAWPETAVLMKPLADAFIRLITMMIPPVIFCTIVTGIAGIGNMQQVGRIGVKSILYFEIISTSALLIGIIISSIYQPGSDINISLSALDTSAVKDKMASATATPMSTVDFIMGIIPRTFLSAFSDGQILQVLLISIVLAWGLVMMGEKSKPVVSFIDKLLHVFFNIIGIISRLAPIGAFGAMAYTVGKYGISSLRELGELIGLFYATCFVFVIFVLGAIMRFYCRLSIWKFLKYIRDELAIVLGTSSSETVLPRIMNKLTNMGIERSTVGIVVPTGYSFNLDGTSIYLTMGVMFIVSATHTQLTLIHELSIIGIMLLTSKGAAGVTGSGFIVLAATLASVKLIPQASLDMGLALIFAVDRFMSGGRALTNLIGNGVATIVLARWENTLDHKQAERVLSGKSAALEIDAL